MNEALIGMSSRQTQEMEKEPLELQQPITF